MSFSFRSHFRIRYFLPAVILDYVILCQQPFLVTSLSFSKHLHLLHLFQQPFQTTSFYFSSHSRLHRCLSAVISVYFILFQQSFQATSFSFSSHFRLRHFLSTAISGYVIVFQQPFQAVIFFQPPFQLYHYRSKADIVNMFVHLMI